jgi:hypothetical protein
MTNNILSPLLPPETFTTFTVFVCRTGTTVLILTASEYVVAVVGLTVTEEVVAALDQYNCKPLRRH